jgi:Arc/MetJ-type ribon-helix-helix transcriptional regulator
MSFVKGHCTGYNSGGEHPQEQSICHNVLPEDVQLQVDQLMATGVFDNEGDVLRQAVFSLAAQKDDLIAVAESLNDFDRGERGIPAAESHIRVGLNER